MFLVFFSLRKTIVLLCQSGNYGEINVKVLVCKSTLLASSSAVSFHVSVPLNVQGPEPLVPLHVSRVLNSCPDS